MSLKLTKPAEGTHPRVASTTGTLAAVMERLRASNLSPLASPARTRLCSFLSFFFPKSP